MRNRSQNLLHRHAGDGQRLVGEILLHTAYVTYYMQYTVTDLHVLL